MNHTFFVTSSVVWLLHLATWISLDAQEAKPALPQKPTVYLNHLAVVLDAATYEAIAKSDFLRDQLGSLDTRTVTMDEGSWTGTYLFFDRTFLEFFEPKGSRNGKQKEGDAGICFSVDRFGELQLIFDALKEQPGANPRRNTRYVKSPAGEQVPFADSVISQEPSALPRFVSWVQAYHPGYFKLHTLPVPESGELTREAVARLARQRFSNSSRINKDPLGADVIGVTLALGPDETQLLDRELAAFGYAKMRKPDGFEYSGPDLTLRVLAQTASKRAYKCISVKIALRKEPKEASVHHFSPRCMLRIHKDKTADWMFD